MRHHSNKNLYTLKLVLVPCTFEIRTNFSLARDVGSISNLGARNFEGTLFLKAKGAFPENKKGTSLFIAKSWGDVPPVPPVPTSMSLALNSRFLYARIYCITLC